MTDYSLRNQLPMRFRFMFVFFIIIVIPFLLVGYIAFSKSEQTIHNTNYESVVQLGKNLNYFFHYVQNEQDKLMASEEMQQLVTEAAGQPDDISHADRLLSYVDNVNYSNQLFKIRLYPLKPSEYPIYMNAIAVPESIESEHWFSGITQEGKSFWKVFGPEEQAGLFLQPTIGSVKRLHSLKSFQPLGVVIMDIRPSILADFIKPVKQFPSQKLMLLNKANQIIYSTDDNYGKQRLNMNLEGVLIGPGKSRTVKYNGTESLVNFTSFMENELKLVSITPTKDLNNPVAGLSKLTILFLLFYFLLSLFLVGYITVNYTNPISSLIRQMKRLTRNNFNEAAAEESRFAARSDEVGWLYRGMYSMIGEIQKLLKETKESERRKKQLEFQVLNYQINPHFLYNTLDTIRWKAEAHQISDISEMVKSLSTMFRLSLNRGKELTSVHRELELLRSYIRIESERQSHAIRVTFMIEEDIQSLPLIRLILQPLVENAIRHGIAGKGDKGMIIIQGERSGDRLLFKVTDNGQGIPEAVISTLLKPSEPNKNEADSGIGLMNVHERLRHYFGETYGLEIESAPDEGTTILLMHPLLPEGTTDIDDFEA
jgi:two-component system sensor histidine kinase YesM